MAPYNLKGRNVLITAGSRGLGAAIAEKFAAEGCNVSINYFSRKDAAEELAKKIEKEHGIKTFIIQGDGGISADMKKCVDETVKAFGGLDILVGNAGWTRFEKFGDLDDMSEEEWDKCWNTNVKGQLAVFKAALPTFNANPDGGVFLITSSVAGVAPRGSSMAYAVTKAAQLQLMKCLATSQGEKIRVNAVLPGLMLTEWGQNYSKEAIKNMENISVLKKVTDVDETADAYIFLAKNTSMTAVKMQIDAGLVPQTA